MMSFPRVRQYASLLIIFMRPVLCLAGLVLLLTGWSEAMGHFLLRRKCIMLTAFRLSILSILTTSWTICGPPMTWHIIWQPWKNIASDTVLPHLKGIRSEAGMLMHG